MAYIVGPISITGSAVAIVGSLEVTGSIKSTQTLQTTASWANNATTASYALFAANGGGGSSFPFTGSAIITGSLVVTGSTTSTLGFTGSLQGTSSWATNAITASFLPAATYNITASWASNALTASRITSSGVFGPSGANSILSASYALTASTVQGIGSYNVTQSFSNLSTWTFNHNLGYKTVIVQAYDSTDAQIIPQNIVLTNTNTATITFPVNVSGYAVATIGGALALSTASFTQNAVSASFASTASRVNALNQTVTITGSLNINGSTAVASGGSITLSSGSITLTSGSIAMPNRPAFRVIGTSSNDLIATTVVSGSAASVDYNQGGHYNNTTGLFTAPVTGLYQVFLNARVGSVNAQMQAIVYKNTNVVQLMWEAPGLAASTHFGVSGIVRLAATDTLQLTVAVGRIQFDGNDSWGVTYIG